MFAFSIFDTRRNRLFLARDRLGIKPLYYHRGPTCFAFASEPKALLACPDIPRVLNLQAIQDYLVLGYTPSPATFFRQVHKLPPAHFLLQDLSPRPGFPNHEPRVEPYWDVSFQPGKDEEDEEEYATELRRLLTDSVRLRMISDVPLGAFLSGGVDSSAIVSLMGGFSTKRVRTFSIGFPEPGYSETAFAREVSLRFDTEHEEQIVPVGAHRQMASVLECYDEPLADTSILPTYRLCALARKKVTVCLSGDGGDELFGGYHQHGQVARLSHVSQIPAILRLPLAWLRTRGVPRNDRARERLTPFMGLAARECIGVVGSWSEALVREILRPSFARMLENHDPY
jgi:asparagine synthase (glutamine-hydrolysing)